MNTKSRFFITLGARGEEFIYLSGPPKCIRIYVSSCAQSQLPQWVTGDMACARRPNQFTDITISHIEFSGGMHNHFHAMPVDNTHITLLYR